ncbi:hypothetical protein [Sphingomonas koreensis]
MKTIGASIAALAILQAPAYGQEANFSEQCAADEQALTTMESQFSDRQKRIQDEGEDIERDAPDGLRISGTVKFENAHMALHLPSVTMKTRAFSFDVPSVTMRQRGFKWKVPEVTMELRVVGHYYTIECRRFRCKTVRKAIKTKMPVTRMVLKSASTNIPEFRMNAVSIKTDVPEVTMQRKDLYYKLPHITVADPIPDTGPTEKRGKRLEEDARQLSGEMEVRSAELTDKLFGCYRTRLVGERETVAKSFEEGIAELTKAIAVVKAMEADPAAFQPSDAPDGQTINLVTQREKLIADRDDALAKLDESIAALMVRNQIDVPAAAALTKTS